MNKLLTAILISFLLHLILVGVVLFWQIGRDHAEALWSGGQGSGAYDVAFVELGDLKILDSVDKVDSVDKAGKGVAVKQKQAVTKVVQSGQGSSNTPAGGFGSGLDVAGVSAENAPSIIAEIRKRIARQKKFPQEAREQGWEGVVTVQFQINTLGQLDFVKVAKSSGHDVLDQSAKTAVSKAAPFPYLAGVVQLPMEYRLQK